jgi:hypothetical protein
VHAVSAMFASGVGRDGAVVGLAEDGAGIRGSSRHRTKDV